MNQQQINELAIEYGNRGLVHTLAEQRRDAERNRLIQQLTAEAISKTRAKRQAEENERQHWRGYIQGLVNEHVARRRLWR